jgi:hypothetical protein
MAQAVAEWQQCRVTAANARSCQQCRVTAAMPGHGSQCQAVIDEIEQVLELCFYLLPSGDAFPCTDAPKRASACQLIDPRANVLALTSSKV